MRLGWTRQEMRAQFCWENLWERSLGRPRMRWEHNVKTDLRGTGCGDGRWMKVAQDRVQGRVLFCSVEPLGCMESNERTLNSETERTWKLSWPIERQKPNIFLKGLRTTTRNLS